MYGDEKGDFVFRYCLFQDEIDSREPDFKQLMLSGPKWIQDESDLQQQSLKEQLDNLETGWNDVHILWENRKKLLIQALNHQVRTPSIQRLINLVFVIVTASFRFSYFTDSFYGTRSVQLGQKNNAIPNFTVGTLKLY